jgi:hypothetical protein
MGDLSVRFLRGFVSGGGWQDVGRRLSLGELLYSIARLCFTGCFHATRFSGAVGVRARSKGILQRLQGFLIQIDISKVAAHEADEPDPVLYLPDADGLSGEGFGKIDFLSVKADATATGDDNRAVMKRVVRLGEAFVRPG